MDNIFSQEEIGSSKKNLLLKTAGKVKIQFGKKMIDLLDNNGNINVPQIIKSASSAESIKEDGFYLIDDELIASIGNKQMQLTNSSEGDTYVSFLVKQTPTSEQKHLALVNIGFQYATLSDIPKDVNDGIVYVEDTQTLYTILNGVISEFKLSIPNPFPERFSILQGGLRLIGTGNNNGITFDNITIYQGSNSFNFDSTIPINFVIQGNPVLNIDSNGISTTKVTSNDVETSLLESEYAYIEYLSVDHITEYNAGSLTYPRNIYKQIRRLEDLENTVKVEVLNKQFGINYLTTLNSLSKQGGTIPELRFNSYKISGLQQDACTLHVSESLGDSIINTSLLVCEPDLNNPPEVVFQNVVYGENSSGEPKIQIITFEQDFNGLKYTILIEQSN